MDSIGNYSFVSLTGNPTAVRQHLVKLRRQGVAGVSIWKGGEWADPFTLRSVVDCSSLYDARTLFIEYNQLTNSNPVSLRWAGMDMTGDSMLVVVERVTQIDLLYTMATAGTLPAGLKAILTCEWELQPIIIAQ